ncbi:galactosylceramide sulfotransferase-like [Babylonia areolata]|uniref:galactosylceramide sulfotransferase-like n=1 Tax=Babylonia areolata TaxID=304850 RepID=UPI003FD0B861
MRLRCARRRFCLVLAAFALLSALFLLLTLTSHSTPLHPSPRDLSTLPPSPSQTRHLHPEEPRYAVPPKPPAGDIPDLPLPEGLRESGVEFEEGGEERRRREGGGGGGGGGGPGGQGGDPFPPEQRDEETGEEKGVRSGVRVLPENGSLVEWMGSEAAAVLEQRDKDPQKIAAELWDLVIAPRQLLKEGGDHQGAPAGCVPKHHIFFGKVHKTGSCTVANVLQRYGFTRGLNFLLPRKRLSITSYNYLITPSQTPSTALLLPPPLGQRYHVMWCHAIYHSQFFHDVMPAETVYVTMLRHPLAQFQSSFEYYGSMSRGYLNKVLQLNVTNPLSVYLHDPARFENPEKLTTYVRNKQSQDLGMNNSHVLNATLRQGYIRQLDRDFRLVMITEYFDHSLVLLRRLMCWGLKDILYIPLNRNVRKKKRVFSAEDIQRHRQLNVADFALYEFFHDRFQQRLREQGPDLNEEVEVFKQMLKRIRRYCDRVTQTTPEIRFGATRFGGAFVVSRYDCRLMNKPELGFLNDLMLDAVHKYQQSVVHSMSS